MTSGLRAGLDGFTLAQLFDNVDHRLWGQILEVIIVDLNHGSVGASTEALYLDQRKLLIRGGLTSLDLQLVLNGRKNLIGTTTAEHARGGGAKLHKVLSDRFAVEHGVERSDLVNAHRRHLEQLGNVVHDRNGNPTRVLSLTEIEQWNNGSLFVLLRVVRDDFLCLLLVLLVEFEGNVGVVIVGVTVNEERVGRTSCRSGDGSDGLGGAAGNSNDVGASRSGGDGSQECA